MEMVSELSRFSMWDSATQSSYLELCDPKDFKPTCSHRFVTDFTADWFNNLSHMQKLGSTNIE